MSKAAFNIQNCTSTDLRWFDDFGRRADNTLPADDQSSAIFAGFRLDTFANLTREQLLQFSDPTDRVILASTVARDFVLRYCTAGSGAKLPHVAIEMPDSRQMLIKHLATANQIECEVTGDVIYKGYKGKIKQCGANLPLAPMQGADAILKGFAWVGEEEARERVTVSPRSTDNLAEHVEYFQILQGLCSTGVPKFSQPLPPIELDMVS